MKITVYGLLGFLLLFSLTIDAAENSIEEEVQYLIGSIETSNAVFIRNGNRHTSAEAAAHLSMKYKRGRRYINSSDEFIERIATKSSITKKLYWIEEPGKEKVESAKWLRARLNEYRHR